MITWYSLFQTHTSNHLARAWISISCHSKTSSHDKTTRDKFVFDFKKWHQFKVGDKFFCRTNNFIKNNFFQKEHDFTSNFLNKLSGQTSNKLSGIWIAAIIWPIVNFFILKQMKKKLYIFCSMKETGQFSETKPKPASAVYDEVP